MDSVNLQVLRSADAWVKAGHRAVLATVVATWGSAPRPVGSLAVVRDDGLIVGSVSGGCIEDDLVDRIRHKALAQRIPESVKYGVTAEEAFRFGLPCGGTMELVLEPLLLESRLDSLLARTEGGLHTRRTLDMVSGAVVIEDHDGVDVLDCNSESLVTTWGPRWRLLLIGAGQLSHYVAHIARACDYQVLICDPRTEYADTWLVPDIELVRTMPDDTVLAMKPDPHTAIIALTHDPKLDDMALIEALQSRAFYIGAIGAQRNQALRKQRLQEFGLMDEQLARLHGPVGVKNGGRTPPEIAASIVTEMTAVRYGYAIPTPQRCSSVHSLLTDERELSERP